MSDWPVVWLLFVTYKRTETAVRAIRSLCHHLIYPNLHWHICDDGSGEADDGSGRRHLDVLLNELDEDTTWHEMPRQHAHDFNVGGNINEGLRASRRFWTNRATGHTPDGGPARQPQ